MWPFKNKKPTGPVISEEQIFEENKQLAGKILGPIKDFFANHENSKKDKEYYNIGTIEKNGDAGYTISIRYKNSADNTYYPIGQADINCTAGKIGKELHFHNAYGQDVYFAKGDVNEFIGYIKQVMKNG